MNILKEYTLDYVRRNKKSSTAIMIAILIATTLLSALGGIIYTGYTDEIRLVILENGNWHAELFDDTSGDKLKYVTGHPNVEAVMIKGSWEVAKIDDPRRPYLVMRGLSEKYWNDMPENNLMLEGRIPQAKNEIAFSKQYFEHHSDVKIGDIISLPIGSRILDSEVLDACSILMDGESFVSIEERSCTVVGKLDIATNSLTPAYLAYGFLDEADILSEDQLTVYMRFDNPRSSYKDIIEIARSVDYKPDEYGKYKIKTNSDLLSKYFIFPPVQAADFNIWQFSQLLMLAATALLAVGLFVFIINNAFAMSASSRLRQLGMLQSIGASPKQIRRSVVFESLVLSVIPIPLGLFFGWLLDYGLFAYINSIEKMRDFDNIIFTFGLPATVPSILLALMTVWLSASIPARKISRLSPIEAILLSGEMKLKKLNKHRLTAKFLGIEGELAKKALSARKRSYRTAAISLTLSFALLSGFLNMMSITRVAEILFHDDIYESERNITLRIQDGNIMDREAEEQIRSINGVKSAMFVSDIPAALWLTQDLQSEELTGIGGLARIAGSGKYSVYEEDGKFRIRTNLVALEDESFAAYCKQIGADATLFYDTTIPRSIVVNQASDDIHSNRRKDIRIPFLKLNMGDKLNCEEKIYLEDIGNYTFITEIGFLTGQLPPLGERFSNFQLMQIMPRRIYLGIIDNMNETRGMRARFIYIPVVVDSEDLIEPVTDEIKNVCDKWYGSGDYTIFNIVEIYKNGEQGRQLLNAVIACVSVFLALIGISNVFSTVSGNLQQRQKEFAMLRSVGISPKGIWRMLILEALFFGLLPILLSIPLNILVIGVYLKINMIYISEFLPYLPVLPVAAFGAAIMLSVVLAYTFGGRRLRQDMIVDILKDEAV